MDDKEFKEIFDEPLTEGEKEQVDKIKKYSTDPDEVIKIRQQLDKLASDRELFDFSKPLDIKNEILSERASKESRFRRREDEFEFPVSKAGFFRKFLWLFTKKSLFKAKYPDKSLVKTSFSSLIFFGNSLVLGKYVQKFITEYIFKWQKLFKPVLKVIYRSGWRNRAGKPILTQKEFNIIGTCERLANTRGISEALYSPANTNYIFKKSCLFLNYYYQIVQAGSKLLISSFVKAMKALADEHKVDAFRNSIEEYCTHLFNFFDLRVENSFIIPLLEAMSGETLFPDQARSKSKITILEINEYRAPEKLKLIMKAREESYNNRINKIANQLKAEIAFLEPISADLEYKYFLHDKYFSPIEFALTIMGNRKSEHCIQNMYTSILFFDKYFAPFITMRVPIRMEGSMEYAEIFTKEVFEDNYSKIVKLKNELKKYFDEKFSECIKAELLKSSIDTGKCIKLVSEICDEFFDMGKKLLKSMTAVVKGKITFRPIDPASLGKINIPYFDRTIHGEGKNNDKAEFTLNGMLVKQAMEQIRVFCINFVVYFEPPFRYSSAKGDNKKKKTLYIRIISKDELKSILERFENGEDIDILVQSYL